MTNNEIIYSEVNAKYHTPEQRRAILALAYTPEQIAAKGKEIHFKDVPEEQQGEELEKLLLAGLFHTFHEWKERGKSVKTGEKAAIDTRLWKLDTRPRKTRSSGKEPDALTKAAEEQDDNGNYYKAPAHLFHIGQVEASRPAPAGRFKSLDEIRAYNKMLADQRKAAKAAAEQAASAPAGASLLRRLVEAAGPDLEILVGAGVTPANLPALAAETGAHAFHMSGKQVLDSRMTFRREGVPMGLPGFSEFEVWQTSEETIRAARRVLNEL